MLVRQFTLACLSLLSGTCSIINFIIFISIISIHMIVYIIQSMGKSLTFEQSVIEAIDFHKRHRCKDPLCEAQLWKARHELDLALLKLDKLRIELS